MWVLLIGASDSNKVIKMAKVIKGTQCKEHFLLKSKKTQNYADGHLENHNIFLKMFGVLLFLCLIYIPIINSLGENGLQYPGYLH